MSKLKVVQLLYQEPNWNYHTLECLLGAGISEGDIIPVDRHGTGPITLLNNGAHHLGDAEYVWFVTNVTFKPPVVRELVKKLDEDPDLAAVHAPFASDHPHIAIGGAYCPFVEWTAPMVRVQYWRDVGPLDEQMPYWGHDLDWSFRARLHGWTLFVLEQTPHTLLTHTYLRNDQSLPVSQAREKRRQATNKTTELALIAKYGDRWLFNLWPNHHFNQIGRKTIYL